MKNEVYSNNLVGGSGARMLCNA